MEKDYSDWRLEIIKHGHERHKHAHKQIDVWTDENKSKQTDEKTGRLIDRQTDRLT